MISFCLFADRVCVMPSVVWLSKLPTASKSHDCVRDAVPLMPSLVPLSVPRAKLVIWFRPS